MDYCKVTLIHILDKYPGLEFYSKKFVLPFLQTDQGGINPRNILQVFRAPT